eukprot:6031902-Pyramimonas_sp.AAC.1
MSWPRSPSRQEPLHEVISRAPDRFRRRRLPATEIPIPVLHGHDILLQVRGLGFHRVMVSRAILGLVVAA